MSKTRIYVFCAAAATLFCLGLFAQESPISVTCKKLGGAVQFSARVEGADLALIVTYPKPIKSYLGGFNESGTKSVSAKIVFYLDTDNNASTGLKGDPTFEPGAKGAEVTVAAEEMETTLGRDAKGVDVNGPMLDVSIKKGEDDVTLPEGASANWEMESGGKFQRADWIKPGDGTRMRLRVPLAALGLKAGQKVRATGVVKLCNDEFPFPKSAEAAFALK